jgi:L-malate glycosyltransferase
MSKPAVLVIENSIDVTGAFRSILTTANNLRDHYDFTFIVPSRSRVVPLLHDHHFAAYEMHMVELSKSVFSLASYLPVLVYNALRVKAILKEKRISIVHSNDVYNMLPVVLSSMGSKIPYVTHVRFMPDRFPKALMDFWMMRHSQSAASIVAVSSAVVKQLGARSKVRLIHDPLPNIKNQAGPIPEKPIFLVLSNFIRGKGQDHAIHAFASIHQNLPDWRLRLVGGDMGLKKNMAYRQELQVLAKELLVSEKIDWISFTPDPLKEYSGAAIVLNFSESESFSMTCIEAMLMGKTVIASDSGGPRDIIVNGTNGILVENRNRQAMATYMLSLANDPERRYQLGAAAQKHVNNTFAFSNTTAKLKALYDDLLIA